MSLFAREIAVSGPWWVRVAGRAPCYSGPWSTEALARVSAADALAEGWEEVEVIVGPWRRGDAMIPGVDRLPGGAYTAAEDRAARAEAHRVAIARALVELLDALEDDGPGGIVCRVCGYVENCEPACPAERARVALHSVPDRRPEPNASQPAPADRSSGSHDLEGK